MSPTRDPALIVEDLSDWQGIFRASVEKAGCEPVVAGDLEEATSAIQDRLFRIAIVDISLDPDDSGNRDGMKVLELIKQRRDPTALLVLTVHERLELGAQIERDYSPFMTIQKSSVSPKSLDDSVSAAAESFIWPEPSLGEVRDILKGDREGFEWDHLLGQLTTKRTGGSLARQSFIRDCIQDAWPVIPHADAGAFGPRDRDRVASGLYWSRRTGGPVLFVAGDADEVESIRHGERVSVEDLPVERLSEIIVRRARNLTGVLYQVAGIERDAFGDRHEGPLVQ